MGTNYYFRKKIVDPKRIEALVDSLNDDFKALVAKYNKELQKVYSEMGIESFYDFDDDHSFFSPIDHSDYDIHVGKISCGWKPLMQTNEHFHSVETLTLWYEQHKDEYSFIDEYGKVISFEEYLVEIEERNNDNSLKDHEQTHGPIRGSDGYDWLNVEFG